MHTRKLPNQMILDWNDEKFEIPVLNHCLNISIQTTKSYSQIANYFQIRIHPIKKSSPLFSKSPSFVICFHVQGGEHH